LDIHSPLDHCIQGGGGGSSDALLGGASSAARVADPLQDRGRASADVKALARQHIDELNQKIRELGQLRDTLQDLVEHCQGDHRPDCPILKELASGSCCA
jgi:DNA-binding transcriptional MerR regulator